ncbi:MAG: linear amide hydrolase [Segetibacter sp.]|nr:linear amide hydrolase [Segetibacter sp.]
MKKLFALVLIVIGCCVGSSHACTTFFLEKNGQMAFGKNYDWMTGTGSVNTNLRGLAKSSLPLEGGNILKWTSKYGSTTFNQYGKEFPNGGMNEKGVVVELMWLTESKYPTQDNRPALSVLQWIQYQLDNCSTVDEVVATDKILRITSTGTPQHYLVADSKGDVATIEFLGGKMIVHRSDQLPYPVLANSTYEASVNALKNKKINDNSLDRFSNACSMIQQYKQAKTNKPLVDYSFDILNKVAQPGFTKWSIVYDITNKKIYFKTSNHPQQRMIVLSDFDYACSSQPKSYNLNQDDKGDISKRFVAFNNEQNKKMLKEAFRESEGINIKEELQDAVGEFARGIKCK